MRFVKGGRVKKGGDIIYVTSCRVESYVVILRITQFQATVVPNTHNTIRKSFCIKTYKKDAKIETGI